MKQIDLRCVVAVATKVDVLHFYEGLCAGEIIPIERGTNGFGYDPIFLVSSTEYTMAELTMEQKNQISHRALAVIKARNIFENIIVIPEPSQK